MVRRLKRKRTDSVVITTAQLKNPPQEILGGKLTSQAIQSHSGIACERDICKTDSFTI